MKSKLQEFMRGFYLKRMVAIFVSVVVVFTSMASFTAVAGPFEVDLLLN